MSKTLPVRGACRRATWSWKFCMSLSNPSLYFWIVSSISRTIVFPSLHPVIILGAPDCTERSSVCRLTNLISLRMIFDETGTFTCLLRNLSKDSAH
jgi:hypothetical protein